MRLSIILFLIFISVADSFCQNRNSVWCFGDSAGIDFSNPNNPIPIETGLRTRGSCVSISDSSGQLLFYANTRATIAGKTTLVYNRYNQIMPNGDSIIGRGWYHELVIVPNPADSNLFYLFSIGVTSIFGLYYSVVNMTLDSGRGDITQKNIQLQNFPITDCITAIVHGNGRDWWLVFRDYDPSSNNYTNTFYSYLITPVGMINLTLQNIGTLRVSGISTFTVNRAGNKLCVIDAEGLIEFYDFDRCTGIISNPINIQIQGQPFPYYWGCEFSPSGQYLYVAAHPVQSYLYQYDLTAPNIAASKDTIWTTSFPTYTAGNLKLAPDNKIYFSCSYYNGFQFPYPYQDSVYNMYNMNLGVINSPDSPGVACNFQPYSFYLGGKRTYLGLPNNPDYDMPRDSGSVCDTIQWTGVQNIEQAKGLMYVTYISGWQKLFVNAQGLKGRSFKVSVYDMIGNVIYTEEGKLSGQYFTRDLNMAAFAKGMYIINFVTDKERLAKKFIKD